jgi:hypothetical protein
MPRPGASPKNWLAALVYLQQMESGEIPDDDLLETLPWNIRQIFVSSGLELLPDDASLTSFDTSDSDGDVPSNGSRCASTVGEGVQSPPMAASGLGSSSAVLPSGEDAFDTSSFFSSRDAASAVGDAASSGSVSMAGASLRRIEQLWGRLGGNPRDAAHMSPSEIRALRHAAHRVGLLSPDDLSLASQSPPQ